MSAVERRADYPAIKESIEKLEHLIYGNGEPGFGEQIREQRKMIEGIQSDINESKEVRKQIMVGIVVGIVLAAVNLIITLSKNA
jgi:hypothetical protein